MKMQFCTFLFLLFLTYFASQQLNSEERSPFLEIISFDRLTKVVLD